MTITTTNGKLAAINYANVWQPNLPIDPGAIDTGDQQQFLWGFPEVEYSGGIAVLFFRGPGRRGVTEHQGVSEPTLAISGSEGAYTVTTTHQVSDADLEECTYLVGGALP